MARLLNTGILMIAAALSLPGVQAHADATYMTAEGLRAEKFGMERSGDYMNIDLDLDFRDFKVGRNRAKIVSARLVNGADSVSLQPVGIYGKNRYYYYVRNSADGSLVSGKNERVFRREDAPDSIAYHLVVPYAEWMNGASMVVTTREFGCCHKLESLVNDTLGVFHHYVFAPEWVFVRPSEQGPKQRNLSGRAFIDFPVDKTVIYPEYRRNTTELGKIQATIDSVRDDKDVTITKVWLKGFASPESPYSHNTDLSIGRVAALKNHIQNLYHFEPGIIETDNEPEDWEGLRRYVEQSNISHRDEILAIIDSDMAPDPKEAKIKRLYPAEYKFMLAQYYPALRHTDYRIDYEVRQFTDIDELREMFRKDPSKLDLSELFTLARSYPEGSEEFNDVFDTAVRMYPNDETANLNAATSAMESGNYSLAARFLAKAGDSPQAVYGRGVLAALTEDYAAARPLLQAAADAGLPQARQALEQLDKMNK